MTHRLYLLTPTLEYRLQNIKKGLLKDLEEWEIPEGFCRYSEDIRLTPFYLKKKLIDYRFTEKLSGNYRVPIHPSTLSSSSLIFIVNIVHWCGTFVTTDERILIQYY